MMSIELILIVCIVILLVIVVAMYVKIRRDKQRQIVSEDHNLFANSAMSVIYDGTLKIIDIVHPNKTLLFYATPSTFIGTKAMDVIELSDPAFGE